MASRKKSKNISGKPELPKSISFTTSFCSSFRLIFTFAFCKTLIESKYKHILPLHRRASRRARITRLTDFDWHSHSRSQSVFPVHQRTDYSKMLVFRQAVIFVPSPTSFPPIFHLLLNLFNMAPEIEFASSDFPPSHAQDRQLRRLKTKQLGRFFQLWLRCTSKKKNVLEQAYCFFTCVFRCVCMCISQFLWTIALANQHCSVECTPVTNGRCEVKKRTMRSETARENSDFWAAF